MGQRASDTRSVNFEDVRVPVENLVGGVEGKGWFNAMIAFDLSRPNVAAHATGISRAAFEYALQYADERETFGKKLHQRFAINFNQCFWLTQSRTGPCGQYDTSQSITSEVTRHFTTNNHPLNLRRTFVDLHDLSGSH